jgi:hypothetical protein
VGFEDYLKADLNWPGVIQHGDKRSIEGVSLALNANQAYICCTKPLKLYEVIAMPIEALQAIVIEQAEIGSEAG